MASRHRVAFIGCGRPGHGPDSTGFAMAYAHAHGFLATGRCELVGAADIKPENARLFAEQFAVPATYTDYRRMLRQERPDIVSICTWPHLHAPMVRDSARAGARAIHCEKPMAPTFGEAQRMVAACERAGTQLTFNHQRRFLEPFRRAKKMARSWRLSIWPSTHSAGVSLL